jgi:hypothetical protein
MWRRSAAAFRRQNSSRNSFVNHRAMGVCVSLAATRLLQQMLFGLGTHDPLTVLIGEYNYEK